MKVRKKNQDISEYTSEDIHKIVKSLIAGAPLSRFPESIHPKLLMPLSAAKNEAIVAGQSATIKRIQSIMPKLQLTPQRVKSRSQLVSNKNARSRTPSLTSRSHDTETDPGDPNSLLEELVNGRTTDTVSDSQLSELIPVIKSKMRESVSKNDFRTAQRLEDVLQEVNSRVLEANYKSYRSDQISKLQQQLQNAKESLASAKKEYEVVENYYRDIYESNKSQLLQTHETSLKEYDSSYPEYLPSCFMKVSPHVLQLQRQKDMLVATHRFEEAIPVQNQAEQIESAELETQRMRFIAAFNSQRKLYVRAQQSQLECFEKNWQRKFEEIDQRKNAELGAKKQLVLNIQRKIDTIRNEARACVWDTNAAFDDAEIASGGGGGLQLTARSRDTAKSMPVASARKNVRSPATMNPRIRSIAAAARMQKWKPTYTS